MPEITINCPHCGMTMRVQSEWGGMNMRCPGCQQTMQIPVNPQIPAAQLSPSPMAGNQLPQNLFSNYSVWIKRICTAACILLALIGALTMISGCALAIRVSIAESEQKELKKSMEELSEFRSSPKFSRQEYEKRQKSLEKKVEKWEDKYEDISDLIGKPTKPLVTTGIVIFFAFCLAAFINYNIFSVAHDSLEKTRCPISSSKIIRLLQIIDGSFSLLMFVLMFQLHLLFIIPGVWFACISLALQFPKKLGADIKKDASLAEDATGWMILPMKAALSQIHLPFIAGEIVLLINFFRHSYSEFTGDAILMGLLALLPLIHYLFFLFCVYFMEIGLSIIATPKILKQQMEKNK